ncbi:hypothetical protein V0U79_03315 [Hyphobacterium sp. HN65]|uniref:Uncharacterized protein n=1 Tax=Hyphobacterium lacteum TaxID=3116575 RepID=A0ABU7LNA6_9PROT|nr:hypothetical protein [Hyphobacterium sp. HN65]MEE2525382.1 hypothetical protein [Hyphobacterium sp. HN65]
MALVSAAFLLLSSLQANSGAAFAGLAGELAAIVDARTEQAIAFPAQTADRLDADDELMIGLTEFSGQAMGLSLQIEVSGGPEDLRCIYRGMAQDALLHRNALYDAEVRADRLSVYAELDYLLGHAREIGPIADQDDIEPFTGVDPGCPRGPLT